MLKQVILICREDQTLEMENGVSVVENVETCRAVKVDGLAGEFIRLHVHAELKTYLWDAPIVDWNDQVDTDPEIETRWIEEN